MTSPVHSLGKSPLGFALLHFFTLRLNLSVTPGISWLPTFSLGSLRWKGHLFGVLFLEGPVHLYKTIQLQLLFINVWDITLWTVILNNLPWKWKRSSCCFWDCTEVLLQPELLCPGKLLLNSASTGDPHTLKGRSGSVSCVDHFSILWVLLHRTNCLCPPRVTGRSVIWF